MLARHEIYEHDRRLLPAGSTKHNTQFMFIDSSNGGVNAKPDKVVRSFVMKSARNKKSWSTRPKSPKKNLSSDVRTRRGSSLQKHEITERGAPRSSLSELNCIQPWASENNSSITSPHSSKSCSTSSSLGSNCACDSATACSLAPHTEYTHENDASACPLWQQKLSMYRNNLRPTSLGSFGCLVVDLNVSAENLLHRCTYLRGEPCARC
jgi:hypothetical protein